MVGTALQQAGFGLLLGLLLLAPEWEWATPLGRPLGELGLATPPGRLDLMGLAGLLLGLGLLARWLPHLRTHAPTSAGSAAVSPDRPAGSAGVSPTRPTGSATVSSATPAGSAGVSAERPAGSAGVSPARPRSGRAGPGPKLPTHRQPLHWPGRPRLSALRSEAGRTPTFPALTRALGPIGVWLPLLGLALLAWLGAPAALDPPRAAGQAHGLAVLLSLYLLVLNSAALQRLAPRLLLGAGVVQALVALGQFGLQRSLGLDGLGELVVDPTLAGAPVLLDQAGQRWLRAFGLTGHPNILGGFLTAWALLACGLFWRLGGLPRRSQAWSLALLALLGAALALSFSRGAWLGLLAGLGGCWLAAGRQGWGRSERRALAWGSLALGLALLGALLPNHDLLVGRLDPSTSPLEGRSLAERAVEWRVAPRLMAERPLLGVGGGNYTLAARAWHPDLLVEAPVQPAHSLPLLVGSELGLLGLAAWLALSGQPLLALLRRGRPALQATSLAAALLALFAAGLFDHYLWDRFPAQVLLAVLLGLWAAAERDCPPTVPPAAPGSLQSTA